MASLIVICSCLRCYHGLYRGTKLGVVTYGIIEGTIALCVVSVPALRALIFRTSYLPSRAEIGECGTTLETELTTTGNDVSSDQHQSNYEVQVGETTTIQATVINCDKLSVSSWLSTSVEDFNSEKRSGRSSPLWFEMGNTSAYTLF
jgi:hypothetical protein